MKLVGAYIDETQHAALTEMARRNHRTLADQCRHIFDAALSGAMPLPKASPRPRRTRKPNQLRKGDGI